MISSGSGILPFPETPQAKSPSEGLMTLTPLSERISRFFWVDLLSNIFSFIAGNKITGQSAATKAEVKRLSEIPFANFAAVLAVHGATTKTSAH